MAYYKLTERKSRKTGATKKVIIIDTKAKPTAEEEKAVQMYVNAGYEIAFKSEKRAAAARERIKKNGGKIQKKKTTE
jgi:hypothetical protein